MTEQLDTRSPEPERRISDVETLKALSDPLRLRIIERMVRRLDPSWTVKELAAALEVPATRLYHHVELLLERDLIRPTERRLVSGIVETRYRVAALSFRLDRSLFQGDAESATTMGDVLATIFDTARDEIARGLAAGTIDTAEDADPARKLFLTKGMVVLAPDRATVFRERLLALLDEFTDHAHDGAVRPGEQAYGLVIAAYPLEGRQ